MESGLDYAIPMVTLGALFLLGILTEALGRHTPLPRVTLLLVLGIVIGPAALDILPDRSAAWFPLVTQVALAMVGFLVGGQLTIAELRKRGRAVLWISFAVTCTTMLVVAGGLIALGAPLALSLLLAGISTATAPAATLMVIRDTRADGPFTRELLGVVAVDDLWGIIAFSLLIAATSLFVGDAPTQELLLVGAREVFGALALGTALGLPMAYLTGRLSKGEPTQLEALGAVLLCGGLALWLEVSLLLASVVLGAAVANLAKHHSRPFHAIEEIDSPFLIVFFVLSGASLELGALTEVGLVGGAYVGLRLLGRLVGGALGASIAGERGPRRQWMGAALLPQAGVALGLALVGAHRFPDLAQPLFTVVISSTICFELVGPPLTKLALTRVGEVGQAEDDPPEQPNAE